ncbi:uncharacterized protein K452DRAFT_287344 [Aplosporella prunicola CBS 121167]|uniref:Uncharacterized protein n=1 Tax=Aplosporella prunicola CBS 121167 TaxID=1176127 RepID=A0A6A6BHW0_9PEZI|nr:uncharacterized protein K452DRAFT_287344 [Aplosporella prunicola CBS 121167]KAF2142131.1 hypothetical protein K452DRAFT_287344 [Aplosporella prunicola CBS 121167]
MSDGNHSPPHPAAAERRRSSFAGQAIADFFGRNNAGSPPNGQNYPGPITSAAAQANRRRLSVTTLGLSGSPNQQSPFSQRSRGESMSSATSASVDESPFADDDVSGSSPSTTATSPFARRLSFGARALRDVKQGGNGSGNANDGFNLAENMRSRAERSSISAASGMPHPAVHQRAKSVATMEPPVREMPRHAKAPDAFQERILKGDFYMD